MRYNRMICWVRSYEREELEGSSDGTFEMIFVDSLEELESSMKKDDYPVISFSRVDGKVRSMIRRSPDNIFVFYEIKEDHIVTDDQFDVFDEPNVITGQYGADEIIKNYRGEISDLWRMRINR